MKIIRAKCFLLMQHFKQKCMGNQLYAIKIINRGETIVYSDSHVNTKIEATYSNILRLYCDSFLSEPQGSIISFSKRYFIIYNLCDYFKTKKSKCIFVIDDADPDIKDLEHLFKGLVSDGHNILIEYDSAEKREQAEVDSHISFLKARKTIAIDGVRIENIDDYWKWKAQRTRDSRVKIDSA